MNKRVRKRRLKYGGISVLLSVLVISAVVILNVIVGALAMRYDRMYRDMSVSAVYSISDNCREYLEDFVISRVNDVNLTLPESERQKIKLIFCDEQKNIEHNNSWKHVYDSIYEVVEMFPNHIETEYLNIWENPSVARTYGVSSVYDVVCIFGDRHETMNVADFYVYGGDDASTPTAYNGEKIIASCLMRITQDRTPMCYFTANHGEDFSDYELIRAVVESGYTVGFLDLAAEDIPSDCELLITFDPKQDFQISDSNSNVSEITKLEKYMSSGGRYMVFVSADTFASGPRENFESFLADWGVSYMHSAADDGAENCYTVRDLANSLTVDGYTVLSQKADKGTGAETVSDVTRSCAFGNSTCIAFSESFEDDGNGTLLCEVNGQKRTVSAVFTSHIGAVAWSGGRAVARADSEPFVLMSLSEQECENGDTAYLFASASTEMVKGDLMRSAALGNNSAISEAIRAMGKKNTPSGLAMKQFEGDRIESLTTSLANSITVALVVAPIVIVSVIGIVVLVRRKNS